jgi:hypothetical protein
MITGVDVGRRRSSIVGVDEKESEIGKALSLLTVREVALGLTNASPNPLDGVCGGNRGGSGLSWNGEGYCICFAV